MQGSFALGWFAVGGGSPDVHVFRDQNQTATELMLTKTRSSFPETLSKLPCESRAHWRDQ